MTQREELILEVHLHLKALVSTVRECWTKARIRFEVEAGSFAIRRSNDGKWQLFIDGKILDESVYLVTFASKELKKVIELSSEELLDALREAYKATRSQSL